MRDDYISINRQAAIDAVYDAFSYAYCDNCEKEMNEENEDSCEDCHRKYQNWSASKKTIERIFNNLSSVQPETCDGCEWEYAFGYGECHHCKRHYDDMYEVKDEG